MVSNSNEKIKILICRHFSLFFVSSTQIYLSNQMHKVAIYRRYAYQSQASVVFCPDHLKTIHHVNKHEIVFHNLQSSPVINHKSWVFKAGFGFLSTASSYPLSPNLCPEVQVLIARSITASVHKFGGCGYDDDLWVDDAWPLMPKKYSNGFINHSINHKDILTWMSSLCPNWPAAIKG